MSTVRTLWLMRHAKAVDFVTGGRDFDRPLTDRGRRQSAEVGNWLGGRPRQPTYALCSPSVRTRQTLAGLELGLTEHLAPGVWNGGPDDILAEIAAVDDAVVALLVIGHGPGLPALADVLAENSTSELRDEVAQHFPTAAIAEFTLASSWAELTGPDPQVRLTAYRHRH